MSKIGAKINGVVYEGWPGFEFRWDLDTLAPSFDLTTTDDVVNDVRLAIGQSATLSIDGESVCKGFVDDKDFDDDANDNQTTLKCRSKLGDLVDCSATNKPGNWKQQPLLSIVKDLVKPFGVTVVDEAHAKTPLRSFTLESGETVFTAIDRVCRMRGVLPTATVDGKLVLRAHKTGPAKWSFTHGVNCTSTRGKLSMSDRFSEYIVRGQQPSTANTYGTAAAQLEARARDSAVPRYRPMVIMTEIGEDVKTLQDRANWEARTRRHKANRFTIKVPNYGKPGTIYRPGDFATFRHERRGIDGLYLIASVALLKNTKEGEVGTLELTLPDAYSVLTIPEGEPAEK